MGAVNAVIDSDVLIDFLQGVPAAKDEVSRYSRRVISVITYAEVLAGTEDEFKAATRQFLQNLFRITDVTQLIAEQAAVNRRQYRHKLPDALIFATAQIADCLFVTRNTKDFPQDDPRVRIPYSI